MQLTTGFSNPPIDAARAFRLVLDAMAHPARIVDLPEIDAPAPCSPAAATVLLTLVDDTTPLHLAGAYDCDTVRDWVGFHLGAPLASPQDAAFALGTWDALGPLDRFAQGNAHYPDRSATLIVDSSELRNSGARLTGPGIKTEAFLALPDIAALQGNAAQFPRGVDFLFTSGAQLAALPRSTQIGGA
ncbi:phosphonate C-P lyase system protein PhnH [Roseinatronobacter sp.]|uniref:phosphonate C-P lyase system protein PhnH n=1 Tax=Roseinatronobacter sp. TaxID=1945755 RepID=UPI0025D21489|nr:phosphonate C-P lyase system protein PhnH [Roseibaca sp.]